MPSKKELLSQEVAKAVGAGKVVEMETVDYNDPDRLKVCLEVDFPIVSINEIASLEAASGALKKPVYQMSKWWARRQSSVFRSMLIAAATQAPQDTSYTGKLVWENYYANHQKKGSFKNLKVVDIFMGGGTTLVEGARLGMQMVGTDLNPVAWFVVKQELSNVDMDEVKRLLAEIEADVKPQIMPYYCCDGPDGEKGDWTHVPTKRLMPSDFDPLTIPPEIRDDYIYDGPEIIYTFWSKHGPCQVTGCEHRTPIMNSPVVAAKTLNVKHWDRKCKSCNSDFHVEEKEVRLAPDVPLYVAPSEHPFTILDRHKGVVCPYCGHTEVVNLRNGKSKKIELSLLVHPEWFTGGPKQNKVAQPMGGTAQDDSESTIRWNDNRAEGIRLLEVRGALPKIVTCPRTNVTFNTTGGTVPKKSHYSCAACGTVQDVLETIKATKKTGPMAGYAVQGYSAARKASGAPFGMPFFSFLSMLGLHVNTAQRLRNGNYEKKMI